MTETILVVDDEESVRRTFREWLEGASLGCLILLAEDAEAALRHANQQRIDLAILDWNLGAGNDGLKLLEDLQVFHPDVVAILVTGFADQATPVQAMRMGVRDYLDKNQDLNRNNFLRAVRNQLDRIRPARRERLIQQGLRDFHDALEKILPLVQTTTTLQEPVGFPEVIRTLLQAYTTGTGAGSAYLVLLPEQGVRVFNSLGETVPVPDLLSGPTLASLALPLRSPLLIEEIPTGTVPFSFETLHSRLLAVPLTIHPQLHAVVELFPSPEVLVSFGERDRQLAGLLAPLAEDLLRLVFADRHARRLLLDAIQTALRSSQHLAGQIESSSRPEEPPNTAILDTIRQGLPQTPEAAETVRLAEAIRELSVRHGSPALQHCLTLVESLRTLLDQQGRNGDFQP